MRALIFLSFLFFCLGCSVPAEEVYTEEDWVDPNNEELDPGPEVEIQDDDDEAERRSVVEP